jgi:hypothetical protein
MSSKKLLDSGICPRAIWGELVEVMHAELLFQRGDFVEVDVAEPFDRRVRQVDEHFGLLARG